MDKEVLLDRAIESIRLLEYSNLVKITEHLSFKSSLHSLRRDLIREVKRLGREDPEKLRKLDEFCNNLEKQELIAQGWTKKET